MAEPGTLIEVLRRKGLDVRDRTQHDRAALILAVEPRPCFFCGRMTFLVDLDYQAAYCGDDDEAIVRDLERMERLRTGGEEDEDGW